MGSKARKESYSPVYHFLLEPLNLHLRPLRRNVVLYLRHSSVPSIIAIPQPSLQILPDVEVGLIPGFGLASDLLSDLSDDVFADLCHKYNYGGLNTTIQSHKIIDHFPDWEGLFHHFQKYMPETAPEMNPKPSHIPLSTHFYF